LPDSFTVIDDFLPEDAWSGLWTEFQFMDLLPVSQGAGAWKLDDGVPLGSEEVLLGRNQGTAECVIGQVLSQVSATGEALEGLVGDDWDRISGRAYVYPKGTGLSWHVDDSDLYTGAFTYYAHPHWNAHWGGELMVAPQQEDLPIMGYRFANDEYSSSLLEDGRGSFIAPKPNRLVLLAGAPHQVAPVRGAAGDMVRASVSGFFLRPGAGLT